MSGTELYRRAVVRFAISLILTIADALLGRWATSGGNTFSDLQRVHVARDG